MVLMFVDPSQISQIDIAAAQRASFKMLGLA
jgi:hypothetical protein